MRVDIARAIAVAIAVPLCGAYAQRSPPASGKPSLSPFAAYGQRIQFSADSVVYLLTLGNGMIRAQGTTSAFATLDSINATAHRMVTMAGDFDAVSPPSTLDRLHNQLVASLRRLAETFQQMAVILVTCAAERQAGLGCNEAQRDLDEAVKAYTIESELQEYKDARHRAQVTLAAHHVSLPDLVMDITK